MAKQLLNTVMIPPQRDLAQLQEDFQQVQDRPNQLWSSTTLHAHWGASTPHRETAETSPDTAAMLNLQDCRQTHTHGNAAIHRYLVPPQRQMSLTTSVLQNIHTFDDWDTTKFEDWLSDIETAVDNLKENHAHLAKSKSHRLTNTLVCKNTSSLEKLRWHKGYPLSEAL